MIDTISITIPKNNFQIIDHNKFSPNTENLFKPPYMKVTGRAPFKAINNPSKQDKEKYGYLPRLTLFKVIRAGGFQTFLKIEFSIPKLLYGNNFDEIVESDFGEVCWKLKKSILLMGVSIIDVKLLTYAEVSTIHYSKNIVLTDYTTSYTYLKELSKININKLQDTNQSDYRNEGHSFRYRSNDYEVVLYDKLADLKQARISDKRSIEKNNYIQLNLFDSYNPKKPFEVIRIEVRLGSRNKIRQIIEKNNLGITVLNFNNLFNKEISRSILLGVMEDIENAYPNVLKTESESLDEFAAKLLINNSQLNYNQFLKFVGAKVLISEVGIRDFRKLTEKFGNTQWYRLNKSMKNLNLNKTTNIFENIHKQIEEFKEIRLENYKNNL